MVWLQCCLVLTLLVLLETAAISARSVYTIQPCTVSRRFMQSHIPQGASMFTATSAGLNNARGISPQFNTTGLIQKNPFKIYKLFTNLFHEPNVTENAKPQHDARNMARKSNTKVRNSSAHLLKGRNPYCSWWLMYSYQSKLIGSVFFWILHGNLKKKSTTVWSWEMQFLTDKLIVFP